MVAQQEWNREADVVVLGMGAAGCAAALEAHDAGARVLILEKMSSELAGGNTRLSGGIWFDNTDPERAEVYLRSLCGRHTVPDAVVRVWAEETARNSAWLERLGARVAHYAAYTPEYPELEGSDCYGGYFGIDGKLGGGLLYDALAEAIRQRGIEVLFETRGEALIQGPAGNGVVGVSARQGGRPIRVAARGGVVLATGGFEADAQMVQDYLGLVDVPRWGTPAATGDGHRMAQAIGADFWHMGNMAAVMGLSAPGFAAGFPALGLMGWRSHIFVGLDGTRFVDETTFSRHGHGRVHGRYEIYPYQKAHVVFDEAARRTGPLVWSRDIMAIGWNLLVENYEWSADNQAEIAKGWIVKADTIEELAGRLGLDPARLRTTVDRYNRYCGSGVDEQFGRPAESLAPVAEPPFYAFTSGPLLGWSNGGPRRDEGGCVLDVHGAVIAGLYAAGTVSSTYSWCKDGGFHIADAFAFGRVAGRAAAARAGS